MTERKILATLRSNFIVDMQYAFQTEDKLFLILEFVSGGELLTYITFNAQSKLKKNRAFTESNIRFYAAELIVALKLLHRHGIVYRDIKPENILVDSRGHIKLADFGLSKISDGLTFTLCGTPEYVAPEVLLNMGYDKTIDWWSFGMLLYEMYTGFTLFKNCTMTDIVRQLRSEDDLDFGHINKASPKFTNLLKSLLVKDPRKRLGFLNDACDLISHPFFENINWSDVENRTLTPPFMPAPNN